MSVPFPRPVVLLGVPVHPVTMEEAVAQVRAWLREGGSHLVVTLNAPMLGRAARDDAYRRIVSAAALVTPDGMGTLLVGRILGRRLPERVAGVDLADRLCALCAREGFRVYFLGAAPGVAEAAAARLRERHPGLPVAGTAHGYFSPAEEPEIVDRIRAAGTDLLLVALGAPRQEFWLAAHLARTGARVGMGVGGTFDVYAGRTRRSPPWLQRAGLEWLDRALREPRRWSVAAGIPGVLWLAVKARLAERLRLRRAPD